MQPPPACMPTSLASMQLSPACMQPSPACTQPSPACTRPSPACMQPSPACTQPSPACMQRSPACTQPLPACVQRSPACTRPLPACVQRSPACMQRSPACTQPLPACVQQSPACMQPASPWRRRPSRLPCHVAAQTPPVCATPLTYKKRTQPPFAPPTHTPACMQAGHVLISPRRVLRRFADLSAAEVCDLWALAQRVGAAIEPHFGADALTLAMQVWAAVLCLCACMHACVCACPQDSLRACAHVGMHACMCTRMCACAHACCRTNMQHAVCGCASMPACAGYAMGNVAGGSRCVELGLPAGCLAHEDVWEDNDLMTASGSALSACTACRAYFPHATANLPFGWQVAAACAAATYNPRAE
eukprot:364419-Chlamydomonas_euryale.AAC.2